MASHLEDQEPPVAPVTGNKVAAPDDTVPVNGDAPAVDSTEKQSEAVDSRAAESRPAEQRAERPSAGRLRTAANEARQAPRGNGRGSEARPPQEPPRAPAASVENRAPAEAKPAEAPPAAAAAPPNGPVGQRRGRHSLGNTGVQGQRNGTTTLDLVELKDMSIQALNQIAKDLGVPGAAGLRKQELIFKIL